MLLSIHTTKQLDEINKFLHYLELRLSLNKTKTGIKYNLKLKLNKSCRHRLFSIHLLKEGLLKYSENEK